MKLGSSIKVQMLKILKTANVLARSRLYTMDETRLSIKVQMLKILKTANVLARSWL